MYLYFVKTFLSIIKFILIEITKFVSDSFSLSWFLLRKLFANVNHINFGLYTVLDPDPVVVDDLIFDTS